VCVCLTVPVKALNIIFNETEGGEIKVVKEREKTLSKLFHSSDFTT